MKSNEPTELAMSQRKADPAFHYGETTIENEKDSDLSAKASPAQMLATLSHCSPSLYRSAYRLLEDKSDAETRLVVGFQYREDAERFQEELQTRLAKFGLELNTDKTRLIEFGRRAERDRKRRGEGKLETFNFLGFTHSCGRHRKGYFTLWQKTTRERMVRS